MKLNLRYKLENVSKKISRHINSRNVLIFIMFLVLGLGTAYSAFGTNLNITGTIAKVRQTADIRITGFSAIASTDGGTSTYAEYSVKALSASVVLPSTESTVTYKVSVTNIGNVEMGIAQLTGIPDDIDYTLDGYEIGEKLCSSSGSCSLGTTNEFNITLKRKNTSQLETYVLNVGVDFEESFNVTFDGIECSECKTTILKGMTYEEIINTSDFEITMNGNTLIKDTNYTYDTSTKKLTIPNVTGNISISNSAAILVNGSTFVNKIKEFNTSLPAKKIVFLQNGELPTGYTYESLSALSSKDVSQKTDGSIMAYYETINGAATIYIYSDGEIYLNPDSSGMFRNFNKVTTLVGFDSLNSSKVIDMSYMFYLCGSLTELDLSNFDTSNVIDMSYMFDGDYSLEELDLSSFDTSNVTNMSHMFNDCSVLESLDVSSFDTSNVTDMSYMFSEIDVMDLDLSSFNTAKVTTMVSMFEDCMSLTELDLSSFDTSNVTDMSYMFSAAIDIEAIYVGSTWQTAAITTDMFNECGVSSVTLKTN